MAANPYAKYQAQTIMTMTQGEMVVRLYDEIDHQLNRAIVAMDQNDMSKSNQALQKAQKIVNHLKCTLNQNYEVATSLSHLYDYFISQIVKANIRKDKQLIIDLIPLVIELKVVFAQGEKLARIG